MHAAGRRSARACLRRRPAGRRHRPLRGARPAGRADAAPARRPADRRRMGRPAGAGVAAGASASRRGGRCDRIHAQRALARGAGRADAPAPARVAAVVRAAADDDRPGGRARRSPPRRTVRLGGADGPARRRVRAPAGAADRREPAPCGHQRAPRAGRRPRPAGQPPGAHRACLRALAAGGRGACDGVRERASGARRRRHAQALPRPRRRSRRRGPDDPDGAPLAHGAAPRRLRAVRGGCPRRGAARDDEHRAPSGARPQPRRSALAPHHDRRAARRAGLRRRHDDRRPRRGRHAAPCGPGHARGAGHRRRQRPAAVRTGPQRARSGLSAVVAAVRSGRLSRAEATASVRRVLALRSVPNAARPPLADPRAAPAAAARARSPRAPAAAAPPARSPSRSSARASSARRRASGRP